MGKAGTLCPVVGVGASAGGPEAFRRLLGALPAAIPVAFVLIQHLADGPESEPPGPLAAACGLPIVQVDTEQTLVPGTVYVVADAHEARIEGDVLHVSPMVDSRAAVIDGLFASLAARCGETAVAVLLSGVGADGIDGLRVIRSAGGVTLVQDPATAEYDDTPRAAIDACVADFIGSPEDIANEIVKRAVDCNTESPEPDAAMLAEIIALLRDEKRSADQALRAAKEEIRSGNEELQNTNEELETAKEELQAANEELLTVNEELMHTNRHLVRSNDDVRNFMASTEIPMLMVGPELRIRRFTPQASAVLHITDVDEGRPLTDLRWRVDCDTLVDDVLGVMAGGPTVRREVTDEDGRWYSLQVRQYRTSEDTVAGAVLTFIDIDDLKRSVARTERISRLRASLHEIDVRIASALEPDAILQSALDDGVAALGVDIGAIEMREEGSWVVRFRSGLRENDVATSLSDADAPMAMEVARTRAPLAVSDTGAAQVDVGFVRAHGIKSSLVVPLIVREMVIGAILFHTKERHKEFKASEIDFASRLGTSVSLALENARLVASDRDRLNRINTLFELTTIATSSLKPEDATCRALEYVVTNLGVYAAAAWMRNDDDATMGLVGSVGFPQAYVEVVTTLPLDPEYDNAKAVLTGEPVVTEDLEATHPTAYARFEALGATVGSFAIIPIRSQDVILGSVGFAWSNPRRISESDLDLFGAVAGQLGLALENARLYEEEQTRTARLRALSDITGLVTSSLDLAEVVDLSLGAAMDQLGTSAVSLWYFDPSRERLELVGAQGFPTQFFDDFEDGLTLDQTFDVVRAFGTDAPVIHEDAATSDVSAPVAQAYDRYGIELGALVVLPLRSKTGPFGALTLAWPTARTFSQLDMDFDMSLANAISTALENARLFDDVRESDERTTTLLDSISDAFVAFDPEWRYTYVNDKAEQNLLKSREELLGRSLWEAFPDSVGTEFEEQYRTVMEERIAVSFEAYYEGLEIWVNVRAYPARDGGISVFYTDVTDIKRAEAAVAESRARADMLARLLQDASQPFGVGALDGSLLLVNTAFEELTGYTTEELQRIDWSTDLTPPEFREMESERLAELAGTGLPVRYEKEYIRKDGSRVPIELLVHVARDEAGEPEYFYSFLTDITERKRTERVLAGIGRIFEAALIADSEAKLGEICLEVAQDATNSEFGFIGEIGEDGLLHDIALSDPGWKLCTMQDTSGHRRPPGDFELHGLYGRVIEDSAAFFTNEPSAHPDSIGTPEGHPAIKAFLGAPLVSLGRTTGMVAVANKEGGYSDEDRQVLEAIATAIVEAYERKRAETRVRRKLEAIVMPEGAIGELELADVIDVPSVQSMMDDFYDLTSVPMAIIDDGGNVLVGVGWQRICTEFHRVNPETCAHCRESDTRLTADIPQGEAKLYQCKNGMWDMASPIFVGDERVGNVFSGQFFFENEQPDIEFFEAQAARYGFEKAEYLAALETVPRLSRETVDTGMAFLMKLAGMLSQLSYSTIKLARSVSEREAAEAELAKAVQLADAHINNSPLAVIEFDRDFRVTRWSDEAQRVFGWAASEIIGVAIPEIRWVYEEDAELVASESENLFSGASPRSVNINRNYRKDGTVVECEWYNSAIYDAEGNLVSILSQVLDITERRSAEAERERYLARLVRLIEVSTDVLAASTQEEMLQRVVDAASSLVGSRLAVAGHGFAGGTFRVGVTSPSGDESVCPEGKRFTVEKAGVYLALLESAGSLRLTDEELRSHPRWQGLPDGHATLRGLLGASIADFEGHGVGLIMLSDKREGDFTEEDELLLRQLASIASLGMQQLEAKHEVEGERNRLRQIIEEIPVGVVLIDADGAVLVMNRSVDRIWAGPLPHAASLNEYTVYVGAHHDTGVPLEADEWPAARVVATGEPADELIDITRFDGEQRTVHISAVPIRHRDGSLARVIVITDDVTPQIEERRLIEALNEIGAVITASFDQDEILEALATMGAAALGVEAGTASTRDAGGWVVRASFGMDDTVPGMRFTDEQWPVTSTAIGRTTPVACEDLQHDAVAASGTAREKGTKSMLVIPLLSQGETIAALGYHYRTRPVQFSNEQLEFATKLMNLATVALESALLYQREHRIAETLQEAILTPPPHIDGLEVATLYRPASAAANVGGDFYDVFPLGDGRVSVLIGDVSGKGLEAARLTSVMRDGARAYVLEDGDPVHALSALNGLAFRSSPVEAFATALLGVLDLGTGDMAFCGAGHPSGVVVRPDSIDLLPSLSTFLGAFDHASFKGGQTHLDEGDLLVFYTDGFVEARRGSEMFGEFRLVQTLDRLRGTPTAELPQTLFDELLAFSGGELRDDTIILCVERLKPAE